MLISALVFAGKIKPGRLLPHPIGFISQQQIFARLTIEILPLAQTHNNFRTKKQCFRNKDTITPFEVLTDQIWLYSRYFKGSLFAAYCKMEAQPLL